MTDRHQQKPYPLRMPDDLRAKLEDAAKEGSRSLHAEIVARLQASFTPPEAVRQRRGLSALAEINSMRDLANRAKNDEELAEYMRSSGLSAVLSNSPADLLREIQEQERENLKKLVAQAVGDTMKDAFEMFRERERKEREQWMKQVANATIPKPAKK